MCTLTKRLTWKIGKAFSTSLHLWFCIRIPITIVTGQPNLFQNTLILMIVLVVQINNMVGHSTICSLFQQNSSTLHRCYVNKDGMTWRLLFKVLTENSLMGNRRILQGGGRKYVKAFHSALCKTSSTSGSTISASTRRVSVHRTVPSGVNSWRPLCPAKDVPPDDDRMQN